MPVVIVVVVEDSEKMSKHTPVVFSDVDDTTTNNLQESHCDDNRTWMGG